MKQFLMTLAERGVRLTVQDGKLFVAAGLQHLTDADKLQLQQQRQEIIRFIGARDPHNSRPEIRPAAAGTQVLSFAQQRLWFIDQLQGGSAEYNIPLAFCLHGQPDLNAITAAFNQILQRHQILRTVYRTVQGMPQTEVLNTAQLVLNIVDRRKAQAALPVSAWLAQEAGRPFDLANDLMLRVSYLQLADADRADYGDADGILLLNLHHIAADGWSMDVLFREFVQAYQLASGAEVAPLPPLQIQYADYASWQREWAQGARHQAQLQYWQQQLADAPVLHQLPLQQPRPATKQTAGALVSATLGADCAQALLALARRYQLTPFMLLHAALALVLSRHSASHDIVLGSPLANRPDPQLEPLIGFFVNTLVFRLDTRKPDLASYLAHVRQVHLDAQQHQDVPFEQLVDLLQIPRAANHSPLFQILLTTSNEFQPLRQPVAAQLGNVQIRPLDDSELTIKFDLDIHLTLSDDAVSSGWIYDQSLFSHDQISRMNQHLLNVLQSLAALAEAEPAQFVGLDQIRMLSHAELQQLQLQPRQQMPLPVAGIHQLFEKQVQQQPAQIALIDGAQQLSYQALDQQAEAVAAYLLDVCQLQPGQPVGIYMTRSAAQIATVLGILKAGGAYVPLDLTAQPQRLAYIVADVALTLLCHDASALPEGLAGLQQVPIADVLAAAAPHAGRAPQPVQATDLAYILYTSGSTGTPKGVCQTHGTLVNLVEHQAQADGVTAALPTLQFTPLTFDVSVQELATCWRTGSPLVLCSQQQKDQLDQLADLLAQQQIGRLFLPPAVFELLTEQLQATGATLPALREVFVAGDVCRMTPDLRSFMQQHPQCRVFNHYGPTETHVVSSYQLHSSDEGDCSIGMAVANTALLVLDPALSPVPLGCIGELYVAGPGVARGYANSEQRSADSFIANPYAGAVPALARMYKTGDLVVQQADGRLSFIGRADQQLKIRGFRIEPAEIELQLQQYPGIDSALVLAVPGPAGQKQLVAYLRRTPDADATAEAEQALTGALKNYLGSVLPPYMVPAQLLFVSQWPLTVNGKINRAALPPVRLLSATQQLIAPACPLQSALRDIWAGLLQVPAEQLCVQANFFDCGGHSLLAVRLVAAVRAQLAAELTVRDIFTAGTIAAQALLCQQRAGQPVRPALTVQPHSASDAPLSFAQQRLWFIDRIQGSTHYHMPLALQVDGALDLSVLELVLSEIVRRHAILRTVYQDGPDGPCQRVLPAAPVTLTRYDCTAMSDAAQQTQVALLLHSLSAAPFALDRDIPLRCGFIGLTPAAEASVATPFSRGILLLNLHHIACDGWSLGILQQEIFSLYRAFAAGEPSPLPELALQYADFARWQRQWLQGDVLATQLQYWQQQLADAPPVHGLIGDSQRAGTTASWQGASLSTQLPSDRLAGLRALAARHQLTLFMLLQGALALVLSRHSNSNDIVTGTPVANRLQAELDGLIGFFVNILVLRLDTAQATLTDYLAHVREVHLAAQSHQDIAFDQLVDLLQIPRTEAWSPLCQIMLSLHDGEQAAPAALPGLTFSPLAATAPVAKFELDIEFVAQHDGLTINWTYATALFTPAQIQTLSQHLWTVLDSLATQTAADGRLAQMPMLQPAELARLGVFSGQREAYDNSLCIHQLFEQQVAANPQQLALICGDVQLSYAALNARANQLAHYLRAHYGLKADTLVGLCVERSPDMIIATLAILKAGAAYVPLDPAYPADRRRYMLQDSAVALVLTDAHTGHLFDGEAVQTLCLSHLPQAGDTDNVVLAPGALQATDLAYAIYTSGSTGQPKGVLLEHRGIINLALNQRKTFAIDKHSRVLHFASMSFDAGTWEYAMALLNGATLVIADSSTRLSPELLCDLLADQQISHVTLPPAFLALMPWRGDLALQALIVAGEACDADLMALWAAQYPFFNAYGPTEASVCASYTRLLPGQKISIGRPLDNVSLHILDAQQALLPEGVCGELYIGGDGLARGYHRQAELSADKFIWHPQLQQRLYKTGDLVRWLEDGNLAFVGRIDTQVKVRGFRIELSEIEAQLLRCPQVDSALVLVRPAPNGSAQLVAYVRPAQLSDLASGQASAAFAALAQQLRQVLLQTLPAYMLPGCFTEVQQWPLTPNGKIDKKALPAPVFTCGEFVAAVTPVEQKLVQLWAQLLQLPAAEISTSADFFQSGGSSILVTRLESAIRREFALEFSLRDLFAVSVLAQQAAHIEYLQLRNRNDEQEDILVDMDW